MKCHTYICQRYLIILKKGIRRAKPQSSYFTQSKNEEAIYNLAKLKLENSDYKKSKELNQKLQILCVNFCDQSKRLEVEIKNLSEK